jgi:asparagine synthase (glutamine-hydrolysing)
LPGIAGIFNKRAGGGAEGRELDRMVTPMLHESYYTSGTHSSEDHGVGAGFVTIKGSFSDCMPIRNEEGTVALVLTGECFADSGTISSLTSRGHRFAAGDASYLVHFYEEQGEDFFGRVNGWFNGLLIDERSGRSYLFNDRYGVRRIYYYETSEGLYFSSEAKSLLALFPETREIAPQSLGEYLTFDSVLSNRTLFKGIQVMPAGSVWTFDGRKVEKRLYCDAAVLENQPKLPEAGYLEELEASLLRVLPKYLVGDPKCMALTGGIDTRLIMACADARPGELPCLTHGGMYKEMLDVRIARKVAETCGQKHFTIPLNERFLASFPELAEKTVYMTDGLASVLEAHHLFLNRIIRDIAAIKITGKYGSQVIKKISAFHRPTGYDAERDLISPDLNESLASAKRTFAEHEKGNLLSQMLFKEVPWWWGGIISVEFSQLAVRSPYLDNEFVDLLYRSPFETIDAVGFQLGIVKRKRPDLYDIMTDAGHAGGGSALSKGARRRYYRLLRVIEKVYGRDKLPWSLHNALAVVDYYALSPLKLNRLFLGVADYRHYRIWTRDELSGYIKEILLDPRTLSRPFWNRSYLEKAVKDHMAGRKNRLTEIQKALSIELVCRTLIEGQGRSAGR